MWLTWPYNQWYENYLLHTDSVIVEHAGEGYTDVPVITVVGDCIETAELAANINSLGQIISIDVVKSGSGYKSTYAILRLQRSHIATDKTLLPRVSRYTGMISLSTEYG